MNTSRQHSHGFGRWEQTGSRSWSHGFYLPARLPQRIELSDAVRGAIESAEWELALLAGLVESIPDLPMLMRPAALHESLASSRIEGSNATLAEVVASQDERPTALSNDVREVLNVHDALVAGVAALESLPLAGRLLMGLHSTLLAGVRGGEKTPGHFRSTPVWVGDTGAGPESASFIPPLPEHIPGLIADWENFVNSPIRMPMVMRLGLAHHQFESIHPFLDGNGRLGRVLIGLQLVQEKILPWPVITLSSSINRMRDQYYAALQEVRESGNMGAWLLFFSETFEAEVISAHRRLRVLQELRVQMRNEAGSQSSTLSRLVDVLFKVPLLTVQVVRDELGVSQPTASRLVRAACDLGWMESLGQSGRGRKERWISPHIWTAYSAEAPR